MTFLENVLVIGYSSRNIACSAAKAGYNVYAIDAFCDADLRKNTVDSRELFTCDGIDVKDIDRKVIIELINSFDVLPDAIVLGSGFEDLDLSDLSCQVLNNSFSVMKQVSDKALFAKEMRSIGIAHPVSGTIDEADEIGYPLMVKPKCAGGGRLNRIALNEDELYQVLEELPVIDPTLRSDDIMVQEFLSGFPASVSLIANGQDAIPIAVNEQLIGVPWLCNLPFAYCGNITPYRTPYTEQMYDISKNIAENYGLIGSNGVDFLLTDKGPYVIELNARLQGSLDSVEMATGVNLFEMHVRAFEGMIPEVTPEITNYAVRAVMYAETQVCINEDASKKMNDLTIADIPMSDYNAFPDDPLTSIICSGNSREDVMGKMLGVRDQILHLIK